MCDALPPCSGPLGPGWVVLSLPVTGNLALLEVDGPVVASARLSGGLCRCIHFPNTGLPPTVAVALLPSTNNCPHSPTIAPSLIALGPAPQGTHRERAHAACVDEGFQQRRHMRAVREGEGGASAKPQGQKGRTRAAEHSTAQCTRCYCKPHGSAGSLPSSPRPRRAVMGRPTCAPLSPPLPPACSGWHPTHVHAAHPRRFGGSKLESKMGGKGGGKCTSAAAGLHARCHCNRRAGASRPSRARGHTARSRSVGRRHKCLRQCQQRQQRQALARITPTSGRARTRRLRTCWPPAVACRTLPGLHPWAR